MRALVTGGAGFIGSTLVDRLLADGHDVVVLDDFSTGRRANLARAGDAIRLVVGDLRDPRAVAEAVEGCEVVFHQAALASVPRSLLQPEEVAAVNVVGTLGLLVAARDAGCRRVVFASSSSVYGNTVELPKRETMPTAPLSPYAASKAAGESYLAAFQAAYGLEAVVFRYFNVYGPRQDPHSQYAAVVPLFLDALRRGRPATIYGDGLQTRDFTYVDDVVDALVLAAHAPKACQGPMNLGAGRRTSVRDLLEGLARALGVEPQFVLAPERAGDVRDSLADISRARAWLGWTPRTSPDEGLQRVVGAALETAPAGGG